MFTAGCQRFSAFQGTASDDYLVLADDYLVLSDEPNDLKEGCGKYFAKLELI